MYKIISNVLLIGNKFMSKLYLKHPRFTYTTCPQFTKHCEGIQKFRETSILKDLQRNELDKAFLLMMQDILIVKIEQKELFTARF